MFSAQPTLCRSLVHDYVSMLPGAWQINHAPTHFNLKPGRPLYLRGKWRVGMLAVRDIANGDELTYDYGVRSEKWMKKKELNKSNGRIAGEESTMRVMTSRGQGEVESNTGVEDVGVGTEKNLCMKDEIQETKMKTGLVHLRSKRNYFWCPVIDCTSGPVQSTFRRSTRWTHPRQPR